MSSQIRHLNDELAIPQRGIRSGNAEYGMGSTALWMVIQPSEFGIPHSAFPTSALS
jgi:hypothetical protein